MQISACKESPSELALFHFLHQLFQRRSELQTPVFPLSLSSILMKSTLVPFAPLPGIGQQQGRGHSVLIPARAFVPVWKIFCGGCPTLCSDRAQEGVLANRAVVLLFSPPSLTLSTPITDSANLLGEPAWLGTKGKERN